MVVVDIDVDVGAEAWKWGKRISYRYRDDTESNVTAIRWSVWTQQLGGVWYVTPHLLFARQPAYHQ